MGLECREPRLARPHALSYGGGVENRNGATRLVTMTVLRVATFCTFCRSSRHAIHAANRDIPHVLFEFSSRHRAHLAMLDLVLASRSRRGAAHARGVDRELRRMGSGGGLHGAGRLRRNAVQSPVPAVVYPTPCSIQTHGPLPAVQTHGQLPPARSQDRSRTLRMIRQGERNRSCPCTPTSLRTAFFSSS